MSPSQNDFNPPSSPEVLALDSDDSHLLISPFNSTTIQRPSIDDLVRECSVYCKMKGLDTNPVEVLRYLQSVIIEGRALDVEDPDSASEGETNQIYADRNNILVSGMDKIKTIQNYRVTLEVQFYGEVRLTNCIL